MAGTCLCGRARCCGVDLYALKTLIDHISSHTPSHMSHLADMPRQIRSLGYLAHATPHPPAPRPPHAAHRYIQSRSYRVRPISRTVRPTTILSDRGIVRTTVSLGLTRRVTPRDATRRRRHLTSASRIISLPRHRQHSSVVSTHDPPHTMPPSPSSPAAARGPCARTICCRSCARTGQRKQPTASICPAGRRCGWSSTCVARGWW